MSTKKRKFELNIGDRIMGNYKGRGKSFRAKINKINHDNTYNIQYEDGEKELAVNPENIKLSPYIHKQLHNNKTVNTQYKRNGDKEYVKNPDGTPAYFPADILGFNPENNTYNLQFKDGEVAKTPFRKIRRRSRSRSSGGKKTRRNKKRKTPRH